MKAPISERMQRILNDPRSRRELINAIANNKQTVIRVDDDSSVRVTTTSAEPRANGHTEAQTPKQEAAAEHK